MRAPGGPYKVRALVGGLVILGVTWGWLTAWRPAAPREVPPLLVPFTGPAPLVEVKGVPELLEEAAAAAGAKCVAGEVEAWARIGVPGQDAEEVAAAAARAARALGLRGELPWRREEGPGFRSCSWEGELEDGGILYLAVQGLGEQEDGDTYLLFVWQGAPDGAGMAAALKEWERRSAGAFAEFGARAHLAYAMTGEIPGRLLPEEGRRRAEAVLQALQADGREGLEDEESLSLTAYSPLLPAVGEGREGGANLQVALRYHGGTGMTYLHIGSPRLGGE
ncbi:MAG TPA: hypothetical protein DEA73_09935 [Peptococcaceae bacterium]|nr:MAG: hypothetical protein XD51_1187 [Moorella sp. 60_41]HBT48175.1 hypothetical protein [Peptococcaceae bacterium]